MRRQIAFAGLAGLALLLLLPRLARASSHIAESSDIASQGGMRIPSAASVETAAYSLASPLDCLAAYQDYQATALQRKKADPGAKPGLDQALAQAAKAWRPRCASAVAHPAKARVLGGRAKRAKSGIVDYLKKGGDPAAARDKLLELLKG